MINENETKYSSYGVSAESKRINDKFFGDKGITVNKVLAITGDVNKEVIEKNNFLRKLADHELEYEVQVLMQSENENSPFPKMYCTSEKFIILHSCTWPISQKENTSITELILKTNKDEVVQIINRNSHITDKVQMIRGVSEVTSYKNLDEFGMNYADIKRLEFAYNKIAKAYYSNKSIYTIHKIITDEAIS